jgi:hypothetical protein
MWGLGEGEGNPTYYFQNQHQNIIPKSLLLVFFPPTPGFPSSLCCIGKRGPVVKKKNSPALDTGVFIERGTPTGR